MNPFAGILIVLASLAALMGLVHWLASFPSISGEVRRKAVHVGMGLLTLTFPWLFHESWPVWLLAVMASVALGFLRCHAGARATVGRALHDVSRHSWGELCFPWAVAAVFWLAGGDAVSFGIPVLLLTLADAAGALAGVRYGRAGFRTPEGGRKSVEGSLAVFGVSFLCAHLPLLLMTEMGRAECVCAALTLALLVMLMESVAVRGLDNVIIPLGAYFLLQFYREMPADALILRFLATAAVLVMVVLMRRWHGLDAGASMGCALLGYGAFALGGWVFLVPLLGFYARHVAALLFRPHLRQYRHGIVAVLSLAAGTLPWLGWQWHHTGPGLWPHVICVCLHSAINYHGGLLADGRRLQLRDVIEATGMALVFSLLPLGFLTGWQDVILPGVVAALLLPPVLAVCVRILPRRSDGCYAVTERRFFVQALIAFAGSTVILLFHP